jgi:hypothetical protein
MPISRNNSISTCQSKNNTLLLDSHSIAITKTSLSTYDNSNHYKEAEKMCNEMIESLKRLASCMLVLLMIYFMYKPRPFYVAYVDLFLHKVQ